MRSWNSTRTTLGAVVTAAMQELLRSLLRAISMPDPEFAAGNARETQSVQRDASFASAPLGLAAQRPAKYQAVGAIGRHGMIKPLGTLGDMERC